MTTIITSVINGIEIKAIGDGTVEIFSDRPNIVRVSDLKELLTSLPLETSEVSSDCDFPPQWLGTQTSEAGRKSEPGEDPFHPKGV